MKILSLITFFTNLLNINGLSVNSTYMNQYNEYIQKYNKSFSNDNFIMFKNINICFFKEIKHMNFIIRWHYNI